MAKQLARVTDIAALDAHEGPIARLRIAVPAEWFVASATLIIDAPRMLACERCSGGGCDGCGRSGALRAPDPLALRQLDLTLPSGCEEGTLVRVPRPFDDCVIEQLIVEVRFAAAPTRGVRRVATTALAGPAQRESTMRQTLALALVVALLVVIGVLIAM